MDYLLDTDMKPWLLEFNSAPSIMVQHVEEAEHKALIFGQKHGMLADMVGCPGWGGAGGLPGVWGGCLGAAGAGGWGGWGGWGMGGCAMGWCYCRSCTCSP